MCAKGAERKRRRRVEEEYHTIMEVAFQYYGRPLEVVTSFKCLGRVLTEFDNNWPALVNNLRRARKKWVWLSIIWDRAWVRGNARTSITFFNLVVQATLLFVSET